MPLPPIPWTACRNYIFEVDTTALFNSAGMVKVQLVSSQGRADVLSHPPLAPKDSTVYYWRVAILPANGNPTNWSLSSLYLYREREHPPGGTSPTTTSSRTIPIPWKNWIRTGYFASRRRRIRCRCTTQIYPYGGDPGDNAVLMDGFDITSSGCGSTLGSLTFFLVNQSHNLPIADTVNGGGVGKYGSSGGCTDVALYLQFPRRDYGRGAKDGHELPGQYPRREPSSPCGPGCSRTMPNSSSPPGRLIQRYSGRGYPCTIA